MLTDTYVPIAEEIEAYALDHSDAEPPLLARLNRDAHVKLLRPRMIAGHLQGRALKMCCRMMRPKRLLYSLTASVTQRGILVPTARMVMFMFGCRGGNGQPENGVGLLWLR